MPYAIGKLRWVREVPGTDQRKKRWVLKIEETLPSGEPVDVSVAVESAPSFKLGDSVKVQYRSYPSKTGGQESFNVAVV